MNATEINTVYQKMQGIKESLIDEINNNEIIFKPIEGVITTSGNYKFTDNNPDRRKQFVIEWNIWSNKINDILRKNNAPTDLLSKYNELFGIISGWRVHNEDKQKILNKIEDVFNDLELFIRSILGYAPIKVSSEKTCDSIIFNITTNEVKININEAKQLYLDLTKVVDSLDMDDAVKKDLIKELDEASKNPGEKSILKNVSGKIHSVLSKHTPEMSALGVLLKIISTIL